MIKKISKLNNIGKFSSFSQDIEFQYGENNINIIFGFNGSGKTTVSNLISFFADNLFISEEEKKEIYDDLKNNDDSCVELELQDNSKIKYPASRNHSKNLYVFNPNFVSTHVFNGTKGKLKKFSNVGGEIKNKEIDNINEQIETLRKEKIRIEEENKKLDEKHEEISKAKSNSFGKSLTDKNKKILIQDLNKALLPTETIEKLETKLSMLLADYELSKKQTELNSDLQDIKQINFGSAKLDFNLIDGILSKNIQQLSKEILENRIKKIRALFLDDKLEQNVERWFRFGKDVLEISNNTGWKHCPICNTDLSEKLDMVLADYRGYFDDIYEDFIKELKQKAEDVFAIIESVEGYESNSNKLEKMKIKYEKLLIEVSFDKYDFADIKASLKALANSMGLKNDNIQNCFAIPPDIEDNINIFNSMMESFEKLKDDIVKILESKKLNTNTIEDEIRKTFKDLILLEVNQINPSGALSIYKGNQNRITFLANTEIVALQNKLSDELKKIKTESKSISKYLSKMGINHFDVDINEDKKDENIIIRYKNSNNDKNKLKNCLSEGEKTALAFAYFLSKFENEIDTEEKIKEAVIIIDDPISSLDDNRLYSTAYLISENFKHSKQIIVLSHNFLFLKYFNSFYSNKANCCFINDDKISCLPEELRNFETPYFYMLKNIRDFVERNPRATYN